MGKIPYVFRRKNVFFRLVIPTEHQSSLDFQHITISLKTQDKEEAIPPALKLASHLKTFLQDLKAGKTAKISRSERIASVTDTNQQITVEPVAPSPAPVTTTQPKAPLLSVVVADFLNRYDQNNKATFTKLSATLPLLIELVSDKPVNEILQADLNGFFDDDQGLPVTQFA
jgi:hypothetical protein